MDQETMLTSAAEMAAETAERSAGTVEADAAVTGESVDVVNTAGGASARCGAAAATEGAASDGAVEATEPVSASGSDRSISLLDQEGGRCPEALVDCAAVGGSVGTATRATRDARGLRTAAASTQSFARCPTV
jgi:hypothetical protein